MLATPETNTANSTRVGTSEDALSEPADTIGRPSGYAEITVFFPGRERLPDDNRAPTPDPVFD